MRRAGEAQTNGRAKKRQNVVASDDEDEYINPVKGEEQDEEYGDYDYGEEDEEEDNEDNKAKILAKEEPGENGNTNGNGVVSDRATKELVRYMVGAHSQGKIITREKLEQLMVSVQLFGEKETRKGQKLSLALQKCVPYLRDVFGYRLVRFDKVKKTAHDVDNIDFKEKEFLLQTCLPEEYNEANGSVHARAPVSDEVFMAYVVACMMALVANHGVAEYRVLSALVTETGLGQCLHKGKLKGADEMIGLLCKADYLNLFPNGGAFLPNKIEKQVGAAKPSNKNVVVRECKELGLGQRDAEKAEIALGPKMYYEFDALSVAKVFHKLSKEDTSDEDTLAGLDKKILHCAFGGEGGAAEAQEVEEEAEEVQDE
ncbi:hypothetical protein CJU89_6425 [Yarrowia sp. B02]|nr:hypothetical protein CJU89_6425 [Yarrowia sp. B02]